jgi:hypothetical protein
MFTFVDFMEYYLGNRVVENGVITEKIKNNSY